MLGGGGGGINNSEFKGRSWVFKFGEGGVVVQKEKKNCGQNLGGRGSWVYRVQGKISFIVRM